MSDYDGGPFGLRPWLADNAKGRRAHEAPAGSISNEGTRARKDRAPATVRATARGTSLAADGGAAAPSRWPWLFVGAVLLGLALVSAALSWSLLQ